MRSILLSVAVGRRFFALVKGNNYRYNKSKRLRIRTVVGEYDERQKRAKEWEKGQKSE